MREILKLKETSGNKQNPNENNKRLANLHVVVRIVANLMFISLQIQNFLLYYISSEIRYLSCEEKAPPWKHLKLG